MHDFSLACRAVYDHLLYTYQSFFRWTGMRIASLLLMLIGIALFTMFFTAVFVSFAIPVFQSQNIGPEMYQYFSRGDIPPLSPDDLAGVLFLLFLAITLSSLLFVLLGFFAFWRSYQLQVWALKNHKVFSVSSHGSFAEMFHRPWSQFCMVMRFWWVCSIPGLIGLAVIILTGLAVLATGSVTATSIPWWSYPIFFIEIALAIIYSIRAGIIHIFMPIAYTLGEKSSRDAMLFSREKTTGHRLNIFLILLIATLIFALIQWIVLELGLSSLLEHLFSVELSSVYIDSLEVLTSDMIVAIIIRSLIGFILFDSLFSLSIAGLYRHYCSIQKNS